MIVNHEIRETASTFNHRLIAPGKGIGNWTTYQRPAVLPIRNVGTFVACTDYWKDVAPFPVPGKVYLVKEKKD